jgi:hypothetical protein
MTSGSDLVVVIKIIPPQKSGEYTLTIRDEKNQQLYYQMPVIFSSNSAAATGEDCH